MLAAETPSSLDFAYSRISGLSGMMHETRRSSAIKLRNRPAPSVRIRWLSSVTNSNRPSSYGKTVVTVRTSAPWCPFKALSSQNPGSHKSNAMLILRRDSLHESTWNRDVLAVGLPCRKNARLWDGRRGAEPLPCVVVRYLMIAFSELAIGTRLNASDASLP
jgi:hypothetical protein